MPRRDIEKLLRVTRSSALAAGLALCGGCGIFGSNRKVEVPPPPVEVTASGVTFEDLLAPSTGPEVADGTSVRVHYTGWTEDGTRFDSSHDRGRPIQFTVGAGEVVRGWEDGMIGMRPGGVRKITIPAQLAYGDVGLPGRIPPNSGIVLQVELIAIVSPEEDLEDGDGD